MQEGNIGQYVRQRTTLQPAHALLRACSWEAPLWHPPRQKSWTRCLPNSPQRLVPGLVAEAARKACLLSHGGCIA